MAVDSAAPALSSNWIMHVAIWESRQGIGRFGAQRDELSLADGASVDLLTRTDAMLGM
jgi:hypothetical protein